MKKENGTVLYCNGQPYAREAEGLRNLWEYVHDIALVSLNLEAVADAVWEGGEL